MNQPENPGRILERAELEAMLAPRIEPLRDWVQRRSSRALLAREPVSDLVQSAVADMLERAGELRFTDESAFRRWVHQVALHKIVSKVRFHAARKRESARVTYLASGVFQIPDHQRDSVAQSPSQHATQAEDLERLAHALDQLGEDEREIVVLRRFFDVSTPEIAALLEMPESTVRWRLARAMTQLAAQLA